MGGATNYVILFADLIGSTEVAVEVSPAFFAHTYVASYHWAARRAMEYVKNTDIFPAERFAQVIRAPKVAGDEVLSFTPIDTEGPDAGGRQDLVASAVSLAYVTKLYWLASPYNVRRMLGKQFPRDVAVGIHLGPVADLPSVPDDEQVASLHINIAKRIETAAREGRESRIFASYEVTRLFDAWVRRVCGGDARHRSPLSFTAFVPRKLLEEVKGVPKKLQLLELEWTCEGHDSLMHIITELAKTPQTPDVDAEDAAGVLAKNFLIHPTIPFTYDAGRSPAVCQAIEGCRSSREYIECWFRSVANMNRLFFDEYWLVLNCFFVSCSFLRHPDVTPARRDEYIGIIQGIVERLQELAPWARTGTK